MLKKYMLSLALAGIVAAPSYAQTIRATLDGQPMMFDQPPISRDGRLLVPLRGIFEGLGAEVVSLPGGRIKATKGSTTVDLTLGSRTAFINGQSVMLEVPAMAIGGRTLVPVRFVSEAMGAEVGWDGATKTVVINSGVASNPGQPPVAGNPAPAVAPKIFNVVHNGGQQLQQGDNLLITATGDPGAEATVDIEGIVNNRKMPEVSSGRYEINIPIRGRMNAERSTVVVTLRKDGQTTEQEAGRTVTVNSNGNNGGNNGGGVAQGGFEVYPAEGATLDGLRPTIHARLDRNVSPGTVRMFLDGQDVSNQVQYLGNSVQLTPTADLAQGFHQARIQAVDQNGRLLSKDWNFNVRPGFSGSLDVNLTNLANGASVGPVFQVQGQTNPYATVDVSVQARTALIPGVLSMAGRPYNVRTTADAQGRFNVQLDASSVQVNTPLNLTVTALDQSGRTGPARTIEIIRR